MSKLTKINISPFTRAHAPCTVEVTVENKKVVDAKCIGDFFRGFEIILRGRDPRDAPYLTERICGICSAAHGMASSYALEHAAGVYPPQGGNILRNLILSADILQNQVRHFYLFSLPDYVKGPNFAPFTPAYNSDYRLSKKESEKMYRHYFQAIDISRIANEMVTILGGKTPFPHGIIAGGSTVPPTADIIMDMMSKVKKVKDFIKNVMMPDMLTLAEAYPDYYQIGAREPNMLAFGFFPKDEYDRERFFPGGAVIDGKIQPLDLSDITEHIRYAWYAGAGEAQHPSKEKTEPDREKKEPYSWVKAPRYKERTVEGGPLARLWIRGDYRKGVSTNDRNAARVLETEMIAKLMEEWLTRLHPKDKIVNTFDIPWEGEGIGITDAMRGPLGHWMKIKNGRIANYEIMAPTTLNFSPRDGNGQMGAVEEALIGTPVENIKEPIEIGRVVRAFDLCSSCSAHIITPGGEVKKTILMR